MNNLEHLAYVDVRDAGAVSYAEWRKGLQPNYGKAWRDIALGFVFLVGIPVVSGFLPQERLLPAIAEVLIGGLLTGFTLAYLASFLHEAGHFNLHRDKKKNDKLADIFLGILFGISIKAYRKIHWQHHLQLGMPDDTETSYFNALTPGFFLESFTGIHLLKVIAKKSGHHLLTDNMKKQSFRMLLACAVLHLAIMVSLLVAHLWVTAAIWVTAMLIFFPFFATVRQLLEHRSELAEKNTDYTKEAHGKLSRIFASDLFSRLFGSAGFNKHMIHHWDPNISYTRLNEIEEFLSRCDSTRELVATSRTTYFKTLRKLLRS
jgi:fatty acid desaturase